MRKFGSDAIFKRPTVNYVKDHAFFHKAQNTMQFLQVICKFWKTKILNIIHGNRADELEIAFEADLMKKILLCLSLN